MKTYFPGKPQRPIVVPIIIVLNVLVYLAWNFAGEDIRSTIMPENFLVSWSALDDGRYWVLLGSVFSHSMFLHIFINMYVLLSFGSLLEMVLGHRFFLKFYLVAGIVSSISHATVSNFLMGAPELPALGASGSIAGLVVLFSFIFPKEKILIMGIIPIPAIFGAFALIGLDLWGLMAQTQGGGYPIGHGAHLGGAFTGIFYYYTRIRPRIRGGM